MDAQVNALSTAGWGWVRPKANWRSLLARTSFMVE